MEAYWKWEIAAAAVAQAENVLAEANAECLNATAELAACVSDGKEERAGSGGDDLEQAQACEAPRVVEELEQTCVSEGQMKGTEKGGEVPCCAMLSPGGNGDSEGASVPRGVVELWQEDKGPDADVAAVVPGSASASDSACSYSTEAGMRSLAATEKGNEFVSSAILQCVRNGGCDGASAKCDEGELGMEEVGLDVDVGAAVSGSSSASACVRALPVEFGTRALSASGQVTKQTLMSNYVVGGCEASRGEGPAAGSVTSQRRKLRDVPAGVTGMVAATFERRCKARRLEEEVEIVGEHDAAVEGAQNAAGGSASMSTADSCEAICACLRWRRGAR